MIKPFNIKRIRKDKIRTHTKTEFYAHYKGRAIYIELLDSGCYAGQWNVEVWHLENGLHDVDTIKNQEQCPTIEDALSHAIHGAMLDT